MEAVQGEGLCHFFTGYIQCAVRPGKERPFHQCEVQAADFNAGDSIGMYAASGVKERRVRCSEHRAMGVSGDKKNLPIFCPVYTGSFYLFLLCIVFCGACRIQKAYIFKGLPKVTDEKAGKAPEYTVKEISLMTVGEINVRSGIHGF